MYKTSLRKYYFKNKLFQYRFLKWKEMFGLFLNCCMVFEVLSQNKFFEFADSDLWDSSKCLNLNYLMIEGASF